jgi:hypothetical protein
MENMITIFKANYGKDICVFDSLPHLTAKHYSSAYANPHTAEYKGHLKRHKLSPLRHMMCILQL